MEAGAPHARSTAQSRRQLTSHMHVHAGISAQLQSEGQGRAQDSSHIIRANESDRVVAQAEAGRAE
jgi:hypothetical protein